MADSTSESRELLLVKWGGSLITDKAKPRTARFETIDRLAGEVGLAMEASPGRIVLGHGSGSFGHVAAQEHGTAAGIGQGDERSGQLLGLCNTQDQAARLHRIVMAALNRARVPAFSIAPSSALTARSGEAGSVHLEPMIEALELGLLPVVYGDVVLDHERGSSIFSTERVFLSLARGLPEHGLRVGRVLWLGETDGVRDGDGRRIPTIDRGDRAATDTARHAAGGSAGTDVTGGMSHRLDAALDLAVLGAESWVLDGRTPGLLTRIAGGETPVSEGTRIVPAS